MLSADLEKYTADTGPDGKSAVGPVTPAFQKRLILLVKVQGSQQWGLVLEPRGLNISLLKKSSHKIIQATQNLTLLLCWPLLVCDLAFM